ncbi:MAG TPA: type VII secretion protein EccB [Catenuloplanes sp.]|jgi:type VII secretion protein EccB
MASRQDQLHSHQFMIQRVVAALVMRETDPAQSPFRRAAGATLASVLVAAIGLGGVAVYGVLVGSGKFDPAKTDAVVVEKESGARYVNRDGRLHPVVNYASALLIVRSGQPRTVLAARRSLEGMPRGAPLGIVDAPDSLPARDRLLGVPWSLCTTAGGDGKQAGPRSVLLVGRAPTGGRPLGEDAVLARHPDGSVHVIWRNQRHPVRQTDRVIKALGWGSRQPVRVSAALLNGLQVADRFDLIDIPGRGQPSEKVRSARIGQVFVVRTQGGEKQFAVALRNGLAPVSQVQVDILLADERTRDLVRQTEPTELKQSQFAGSPAEPPLGAAAGFPPLRSVPTLVDAVDGALCGLVPTDAGVAEVRIGATVPDPGVAATTGSRSDRGTVLVDLVVVPPGSGTVVEAAPAPGAGGGAVSVVTDLGRRFAVSDPEVLGVLGYGGVRPVRMPSALVSLIPAGPALDPAAALAPAGRS